MVHTAYTEHVIMMRLTNKKEHLLSWASIISMDVKSKSSDC